MDGALAERSGSEDPEPGARLQLDNVQVVINPASGGVGADAPEEMQRILDEAERPAEVRIAEAGGVDAALKAALETKPDLLIVLAGDGTARAAAALTGPQGPLLAPLAGGTMNMLPHALYGRRPWQEALPEVLREGVVKTVGGGVVGEHFFYVAAILGAPALWAHAREAVREGRLRDAVRRARYAYARAFSSKIRFTLEGDGLRAAEALTLLCPLVSRAMSETEQALEADALDPHGAAEAFRLGFRALLSEFYGDWRDDPAVTARKCRSGRVWASGQIPAILDGEPVRLNKAVSFRYQPSAFRALAARLPEPEADAAAAEGAAG